MCSLPEFHLFAGNDVLRKTNVDHHHCGYHGWTLARCLIPFWRDLWEIKHIWGNLLHDTLLTLFVGGPARTFGGSCVGTFLSALWYRNKNAWTAHLIGDTNLSTGAGAPPGGDVALLRAARLFAALLPALRRRLLPFFRTSPAGGATSTSLLTISKRKRGTTKWRIGTLKLTT